MDTHSPYRTRNVDADSVESCLRQEFDAMRACRKAACMFTPEHLTRFASAYCPQNSCKNRYPDILPNECSRVKLHPIAEGDGDYINANYVDIDSNANKRYILTQAPLPNTVNDFWRMVWQEKCSVINCLTRLSEGGCQKAHKYWPEDGQTQLYGHIDVRHNMTILYMNIIVRSFTVWLEGSPTNTHEVVHMHYQDWPDHGTPASTQSIRTLAYLNTTLIERAVKMNGGNPAGPAVIHCSAGVGRAGTFVAIHAMLMRLERTVSGGASSLWSNFTTFDWTFGIKDVVLRLRQQRDGTVQTVDQYLFIHRTIMDTLRNMKRNSLVRSLDSCCSFLSSGPCPSSSAPASQPLPSPASPAMAHSSSSPSVHHLSASTTSIPTSFPGVIAPEEATANLSVSYASPRRSKELFNVNSFLDILSFRNFKCAPEDQIENSSSLEVR